MYIILAIIIAAALGAGVHVVVGHRSLRSWLLSPAIACVITALTFAGLTWLGWGQDNLGQWLVSLLAGVVVAGLVAGLIGRGRYRRDQADLASVAG